MLLDPDHALLCQRRDPWSSNGRGGRSIFQWRIRCRLRIQICESDPRASPSGFSGAEIPTRLPIGATKDSFGSLESQSLELSFRRDYLIGKSHKFPSVPLYPSKIRRAETVSAIRRAVTSRVTWTFHRVRLFLETETLSPTFPASIRLTVTCSRARSLRISNFKKGRK